MKYYITSTFEVDGHSSSMSMICDSATVKRAYLQTLLYDEENGCWYPTHNKVTEEDGSETWYGSWDCGEWAINILPFKTFREICNKDRFTRTG